MLKRCKNCNEKNFQSEGTWYRSVPRWWVDSLRTRQTIQSRRRSVPRSPSSCEWRSRWTTHPLPETVVDAYYRRLRQRWMRWSASTLFDRVRCSYTVRPPWVNAVSGKLTAGGLLRCTIKVKISTNAEKIALVNNCQHFFFSNTINLEKILIIDWAVNISKFNKQNCNYI